MKKNAKDIRNYEGWTQEDFEEDLMTNPHYQTFFKNFKAESVDEFIKEHAKKKFELYEEKAELYENRDKQQTRFLTYAEDFLAVILQKKLFNLQCQWRAGMIDLPFIEYTHDFDYYGEKVTDCPFVDPITEEELEVGIRFLLEEEDNTNPYLENWQDYAGFKIWENDDNSDNLNDTEINYSKFYITASAEPPPDFYEYYDKHFDTGYLLNLPDKRWEKERYYFDAVREDNGKKNELAQLEKSKQAPKPPPLPSIYLDDKETFIEEYEDRETRELIKLKELSRLRYTSDDDELDWNIRFLLELRNAGEDIAFEPHKDWYEAIELTVKRVIRKKTVEMLPYAYQTYMLEFEDEDWETIKAGRIARFQYDDSKYRFFISKMWRETMAEGKALRGEL